MGSSGVAGGLGCLHIVTISTRDKWSADGSPIRGGPVMKPMNTRRLKGSSGTARAAGRAAERRIEP